MKLTSTSLTPGAPIPTRHAELAAGGENVSPALAWSDVPADTKSFAITCYDPDAPTGSGWWHWIAIDVPAEITSLAEGEVAGIQWTNDYGYEGFGGPCPPPGPAHRYQFTVHALDVPTLGAGANLTHAAVRFDILAHALDSATLEATFATPKSEAL